MIQRNPPFSFHLIGALLLALLVHSPNAAAQYQGSAAPEQAKASTEPPKGENAEAKKSWRRKGRQQEGKALGHKMDMRTAKRLAQALEYLQEEELELAERELDRLRMRSLNPFERAQTQRIYAFVEFGKGDTVATQARLQAALDENALPAGEQAAVLILTVESGLEQLNALLIRAQLRKCGNEGGRS